MTHMILYGEKISEEKYLKNGPCGINTELGCLMAFQCIYFFEQYCQFVLRIAISRIKNYVKISVNILVHSYKNQKKNK